MLPQVKPLHFILVILALITLLTLFSMSFLAWFNQRSAPERPSIGVVSFDDIFKATELYYAELLTRKGLSEEEKKATYLAIKNLPTEIDLAVHKLENHCNCWLFHKHALISQSAKDFTAELKALLMPNSPELVELEKQINQRLALTRP